MESKQNAKRWEHLLGRDRQLYFFRCSCGKKRQNNIIVRTAKAVYNRKLYKVFRYNDKYTGLVETAVYNCYINRQYNKRADRDND